MPTTSGNVARLALEGLGQGGVAFAILHGADKITGRGLSDVDIVVATDPKDVVRIATPAWRELGLSPVLSWPYDVGGTTGLFLATSDAREGVQLDILYDPQGIGQYRVRSGPLIESVQEGDRFPVVSEAEELIYLWQKRNAKDQLDTLADLRRLASRIPPPNLQRAAIEITGSSNAALGLFGNDTVGSPGIRYKRMAPNTHRLMKRVRSPVGFWVHTQHEDVGRELARRLDGYLLLVRTSHAPVSGYQPVWWMNTIVPTILRAGVFVSVGNNLPGFPRPHKILTTTSTEHGAAELIEAMHQRLSC